uniref:Uncharacterized protein n=1 Tax=Triticum urartu TaxID=4572 RepID=A0A8R7U7I5_TRIUA
MQEDLSSPASVAPFPPTRSSSCVLAPRRGGSGDSGESDPTRRCCLSTGTPSTGSLPPHLILSPSHERCSFTATLTPSRSSYTPARLQHHQLDLDAGRGDAQPWASSTSASAFVAWPRVS